MQRGRARGVACEGIAGLETQHSLISAVVDFLIGVGYDGHTLGDDAVDAVDGLVAQSEKCPAPEGVRVGERGHVRVDPFDEVLEIVAGHVNVRRDVDRVLDLALSDAEDPSSPLPDRRDAFLPLLLCLAGDDAVDLLLDAVVDRQAPSLDLFPEFRAVQGRGEDLRGGGEGRRYLVLKGGKDGGRGRIC